MWEEITYSFTNFKGATFEVWEWSTNFILQFTEHMIAYPCHTTFINACTTFILNCYSKITNFWHTHFCMLDECIYMWNIHHWNKFMLEYFESKHIGIWRIVFINIGSSIKLHFRVTDQCTNHISISASSSVDSSHYWPSQTSKSQSDLFNRIVNLEYDLQGVATQSTGQDSFHKQMMSF